MSKIGQSILKGAKEALKYAKGKNIKAKDLKAKDLKAKDLKANIPTLGDVKVIRKN